MAQDDCQQSADKFRESKIHKGMTRNQCSLCTTKYQTTNTFHCFSPLWIFSNVWVYGIKTRL